MALIFLALALLSATHSTSLPPSPLPWKRSPADLPHVERPWINGGPCARSDFRCMNVMALRYTNEIRARAGRYPLEMGTEYMLDNAMYHSQVQQRSGNIFHQDLGSTPLGCNARFSGENVAQNFVWATPNRGTDPARICVEQLRDSPPHYKNIISDYSRASVMGIFIDGRDWIWCTQTFAVNVAYGPGKCVMANAQAGAAPPGQRRAPPQGAPPQKAPPQRQAPPPQAPQRFQRRKPAPEQAPREQFVQDQFTPEEPAPEPAQEEPPEQRTPRGTFGFLEARGGSVARKWFKSGSVLWTRACSFRGKDISWVRVPQSKCSARCALLRECTHFAYAASQCWLKADRNVQKSHAVYTSQRDAICGIVKRSRRSRFQWLTSKDSEWAHGCTFGGTYISKKRVAPNRCSRSCSRRWGCTHFSYDGTYCFLRKRRNVNKNQAKRKPGFICGILTN